MQETDSGKDFCRQRILTQGWDGRKCRVNTRGASDGKGHILLTTQMLDTAGSDAFDGVLYTESRDGGETWTALSPVPGYGSVSSGGFRTVPGGVTPMYHKKTGVFFFTGHTVRYREGEVIPVGIKERHRQIPFLTYDGKNGTFSAVHPVPFPPLPQYRDVSAGSSQCFEMPCGDVLLPINFLVPGERAPQGQVVRCSFDGKALLPRDFGNVLSVPSERRGLTELSVIGAGTEYFLTARGDRHGYICRSSDGISFSDPEILHSDSGEILPTYNTQTHLFVSGGRLFLVYTRKNGHNDHVFRNRAPLYAAEIDRRTLRVIRDTEFVVVPERGARLGNFGVFPLDAGRNAVTVSEWMQPAGCEKYGSDNAMWFSEITV